MRKVDEILKEIVAAQDVLAKANEDIPIQVRSGWAVRKEAARQALETLRPELEAATVPSRLVGCFASGDAGRIEEVAALLRDTGGIVVRADAVWERIVANFEDSFGADRLFRTTQFWLMVNAYRAIASELGLPGTIPSDAFVYDAPCPTHDDCLALVRRTIRSWATDELNLRAIRTSILDAVIADGLDDKKLPVLVTGATPDEVPVLKTLFTKAVTHEFATDFEVTTNSVTTIFRGSKDNGKDNSK